LTAAVQSSGSEQLLRAAVEATTVEATVEATVESNG